MSLVRRKLVRKEPKKKKGRGNFGNSVRPYLSEPLESVFHHEMTRLKAEGKRARMKMRRSEHAAIICLGAISATASKNQSRIVSHSKNEKVLREGSSKAKGGMRY